MTTPVLQSATIDGDFLTLTYDGLLDEAHQPSSSYFLASVNGLNRSVANLAINGNTVIVKLNTGVSAGDTVTLSYTDPSAGNDVYAIQNTTGEDAASLSGQAVSNATTPPVSDVSAPKLVSAAFSETSNSIITLTFDEAMQIAGGNAPVLLKNGTTPINITNSSTSASAVMLTTDSTLSATDFVVASYDGSGVLRDAAGNFFSQGTLVIGGSGANVIDYSTVYPDYYPLTIRANGGSDTIIGSDWNDRLLGGGGTDTINGGWGGDNINLSEPTRASDVVEVMISSDSGGSIVSDWDTVYQFDVSGTTTNDKLSLASKEIAANVTLADGTDVGNLAKHSIVSGILTFADSGGNAVTINAGNLNDALGYLSQNLTTPGKAVAFGADTDGNGANDTLFVFQNIQGNQPSESAYNTLIELVGVNGVTLGTTAAQNVVRLIDTTGPSPIDGATTANGVSLSYNETIVSVDFAGLSLQKGNGASLTTMTPTGIGISGNVVTVTTSTSVGINDYVLLSASNYALISATDTSANSQGLFDPTWPGIAIGGTGDTVIDLSALSGNYTIYDPDGGNDTLTGNADDNDINAGVGNDALYGGAGADYLDGGAGNDTLDGGTDADILIGGTGDDTYHVDTPFDFVFENPGEGNDTVISSTSLYLYANVENLTLANGAGSIYGVGNELDNILIGNEGDNLMIAWDGADTLHGGAGNDNLFGVDGNDTLYGEVGIDYLVGGSGDDTLDGGDNPDAIYGEDGNDTLYGGIGFHTDIMVGGAGDDILNGSGPTIHYQGDYDLMDGGAGNDTYYVDTPNDLTFEAAGGGIDSVIAEIDGGGYYLWAYTENLTLAGSTPFGVGNELDNILTGSENVNWLLGGAGNDTINGKGGNDVLFGEAGIDTFVFERGTGGDVIGDFLSGTDKVQLSGLGFASFAQVQAAMTTDGVSTALDLGLGDFVVFNGVTPGGFAAGDFLL
ncbi:MAG: hypothetical protein GC183_14440 [Thiobacillus sp.]|nr:hypothetical protein [Thiobacillus sp.]